ncbi:unnamed protein product, partial [marine sediment metagenome]
REMEQAEEAISEFERALAIGDSAKTVECAYQLAQCYREVENWERCAEYLETALDEMEEKTGESRLNVLMELGHCQKNMRQLKRAVRTFQEVDDMNADFKGVKDEIKQVKKLLGKDGDPDDNISFM